MEYQHSTVSPIGFTNYFKNATITGSILKIISDILIESNGEVDTNAIQQYIDSTLNTNIKYKKSLLSINPEQTQKQLN